MTGILYAVEDGVATVTLNRPEQANAQDVALLNELDAAMRRARDDEDVRVVVLAANGRHFSAGHDLKELHRLYDGISVADRYQFEETHYLGYAMAIRDMPKPVIARVQGACVAGGLLLAGVCDLIIAADDAYFADPVVHFGSPGVEVQLHSWLLGPQLARDLLYTGRRMYADEALRRGLVVDVVKVDELEARTMALAARIAEAPPFALKLTKRSLNRALDIQGFRVAVEAAFDTHQLSHAVEGQETGVSAVDHVKGKLADVRPASS